MNRLFKLPPGPDQRGPEDPQPEPQTPAGTRDGHLRKAVKEELDAHAWRYDWLGRDLARNVSWTILLGAMAASLRGEELSVGDVVAFEVAPVSLILRWAEILAAEGLISIRENTGGETHFALRARGHDLVTGYLRGRMIHKA